MKYILGLGVIARILYTLVTMKPAPMGECNQWYGDKFIACPKIQEAGEPDHIQLGDCKDYLTGKDLDECISMYLADMEYAQQVESQTGVLTH